ncbi:Stemmadenine O-acetyltransferase [Camellia lanceoleosa]|uniref:Stemmadenine O-acetyltransferase n=1 Tax=Camellia lanceoleosa TaxID=1840588 RepID=A0ACC0IXM5_9ERIC|nr:Stemmadenine O-acetyltransferase [Camellia lanceoleosa]
MNLRRRANPPLPESYFGNLSRFARFVPSIDSNGSEGCRFINQMREAIKKIDSDYVKNLQDGGNVIEMSSSTNVVDSSKLENNSLVFASNFLFPLYEVDFGWGKPIWVSFATLPFKNSINFLPRRSGVGIEAWFFMKDDDLAKLEADKEFLDLFLRPRAQDLLPSSSEMWEICCLNPISSLHFCFGFECVV